MRARQPDRSGVITRDGVRVAWEVHGEENTPSVLLLPAWSIADAEHWKFQIPVLARRHRVVVIEGRGNGRSDRPVAPGAYAMRRVPGRRGGGAGRHRHQRGGGGRVVDGRRPGAGPGRARARTGCSARS